MPMGGTTQMLSGAAKAAYRYVDSLYVHARKTQQENASDNGEEPPKDINASPSDVIAGTEATLRKNTLKL